MSGLLVVYSAGHAEYKLSVAFESFLYNESDK
ncbi:hypothetical protein SASC598P14_013380 [Snodgrassella alvi SCGC AB-598-P14]|uniref:Uncharacterized protein n=1 Tax=Snodgrassella alvi SCGC AB-598-J21 TaxID=1385367 RepID=A0A074V9P8_9NEIS|nr:hypothetical protein SASC598J21_016240 [Snodgrassella alvi SCGC AB-598-J21]KES13859.1 hypothetical protein SASC598P14_013380 [Snodgrassella alvi SCGC AB-598-P14]